MIGVSGNNSGSIIFYLLDTNQILPRDQFVELPMPDSVIAKLNGMAHMHSEHLTFYQSMKQVPISDEFTNVLSKEHRDIVRRYSQPYNIVQPQTNMDE
jgi:hypothetical protein